MNGAATGDKNLKLEVMDCAWRVIHCKCLFAEFLESHCHCNTKSAVGFAVHVYPGFGWDVVNMNDCTCFVGVRVIDSFFINNGIQRLCHASKIALGLRTATRNNIFAAPLGFLRPCSQPSTVRTETPRSRANSARGNFRF